MNTLATLAVSLAVSLATERLGTFGEQISIDFQDAKKSTAKVKATAEGKTKDAPRLIYHNPLLEEFD